MPDDYHFGYDEHADELILWKRGRRTPVARIPRHNGLSLAATIIHIESVQQQTRPQ